MIFLQNCLICISQKILQELLETDVPPTALEELEEVVTVDIGIEVAVPTPSRHVY